MTNRQKVAAIVKYQNNDFTHPLTCGNNSQHQLLYPGEHKGEVMLFCSDCDYQQKFIPDFIFTGDYPDTEAITLSKGPSPERFTMTRRATRPATILVEEFMIPNRMLSDELATRCELDQNHLNQIIYNGARIEDADAEKLSTVFGTTSGFWRQLQMAYDATLHLPE